jgi:hypothetical protein
MNCNKCKKNICSKYRGKKWIGDDDIEYCEKKYFDTETDQMKCILELLEKSYEKGT